MKYYYSSIISLFIFFFFNPKKGTSQNLRDYNIVWNSQSENSSESMPLTGHSIGCNVWVENGKIYFYVAQSGAFDENNEALKTGRFVVELSPNPFKNETAFQQELKLEEGYIKINAKSTSIGNATINLWIEADHPVIHFDLISEKELKMKVAYESWRFEDKVLKMEKVPGVRGRRASIFDYDNYLVDLVKYGDHIYPENNHLYFFHNNQNHFSAFDFAVKQQGLTNIKDSLNNPLKNLISGGVLKGNNLKFKETYFGEYAKNPYKGWGFETKSASKRNHFQLYLNTQQTKVSEWKEKLKSLESRKNSEAQLFSTSKKWWRAFWKKSYIIINASKTEKGKPWEIGRNYNLFRYQLGGNTYGRMPTKFNGGNLTFDPIFVDKNFDYDPDFRRWGGGSFTAQNQRLVYWPLLKSGDFETMLPQFEFYRKSLQNAIARSKVYWGHGGSSFTEQMQQSGLPVASHYGFEHDGFWNTQRPLNYEIGKQVNPFVQTLFQTQLEFAFMILEYYKYSQKDISKYLPFIYNTVYFYDHHYQYCHKKETGNSLDKKGKLVLYPTTPGENSPNSTNASDAIAGLTAVIKTALQLPDTVISDSIRTYFEEVKQRIPPIEKYIFKDNQGEKHILLRESKEDTVWHSGFMPALYAIFPYRLITSENQEFQEALNVWKYKMSDENKQNYASWRPGVFMGANLLLKDYTKNQILKKLGNSKRRYPTFWGPGHDWVPDHNWGGSGMIGLQDMLLQEKGGKIHLFPTWPKEWGVNFKLHASKNTVIEGEYSHGKVEGLKVTPVSRRKDIIIDL